MMVILKNIVTIFLPAQYSTTVQSEVPVKYSFIYLIFNFNTSIFILIEMCGR